MKKQTIKRRRRYTAEFYRGNRIAFCFALLSTVLLGAVNLGLSWLIQQMIDSASGLEGTYSFGQLVLLTGGAVLMTILVKLLNYVSKPRFVKKALTQYKNHAFIKLSQKNINSFNKESTANYLSALTNDVTTIEGNYVENTFDLIYNSVMMVGAIFMMLWYSPLLTACALAFFLLPIGSSLMTGKKMEQTELKVSKKYETFLASLKDTLAGFPVIKSFKTEKSMMELFKKENEALEGEKCKRRKLTVILSMLGGIAGVSAQFGTFLMGTYLALSGYGITPGILMIFLDLTANVINPVSSLPDYLAKRKAAVALIDKMAVSLETNIRDEGKNIPARLEHGIELKNVAFGFEDGDDILHNINAYFEKGKSYAIVGASGSGKSTLLNLLMASHSTYSGEINYDAYELGHISSESLYDVVSMIQQNVFVFNDTVLNNITLFRQFEKNDVIRAIERSGLAELIAEKGADYLCGENGNKLSGGEKQRISIARSLLRKTPVLLVDEATAALDRETAYHVSDSILNLSDLTRIVVTHTLDEALLRRYDQIMVMKKGCIVEQGQFEELMDNKRDFYALFTTAQ